MRKFLLVAVIGLLPLFIFAAYTFINPVGPTLVPIASMLENPELAKGEAEYEIHLWRSVDEAISMIVAGRADISLLPVTVGAQLAASGVDIRLAAVAMWNGFFVVSRAEEIDSIHDLINKDIYTLQAPGQTGDAMLRGLAEGAGYTMGRDIRTVYVAGPEAVQLLAAGRAEVIMVPEPFASLAVFRVDNARKHLPVEVMWEQLTGSKMDIPTSGLFVSADLDERIVNDFLTLYEKSMELSLKNTDETAALVSEKMGDFPIPVLKQAIASTGYVFKRAPVIKEEVAYYLDTLRELDPEIVGTLEYENFFAE